METHGSLTEKVLTLLNNVIPFQKETLQEHTEHLLVFCQLVWIPKPNQSIFFARSRQKRQNLLNFALSTTLGSFEDFLLGNCRCVFKKDRLDAGSSRS